MLDLLFNIQVAQCPVQETIWNVAKDYIGEQWKQAIQIRQCNPATTFAIALNDAVPVFLRGQAAYYPCSSLHELKNNWQVVPGLSHPAIKV